jgi:hypothetical protein
MPNYSKNEIVLVAFPFSANVDLVKTVRKFI